MAVYKRGKKWWYKFVWNGELIRESTKQWNKRTAEQMEAAHKASLAKGEVGIRDRAPVPTLKDFAGKDFKPYIESRFPDKPKTLEYYMTGLKNLSGYPPLADCALDAIATERISGFVAKRREAGLAVSSINRQLEVLRRVLRLAVEWGKVEKILPKVEMLPGENHQDRVLTEAEEADYLNAATAIGESIRATKQHKAPIEPADPFLLRDVTTVLIDCGLRPDECFRLQCRHIRDGAIFISFGKTANARRTIPLTARATALLEMRRAAANGQWVFPAPTRSGHIEKSSLKKQHPKAYKLAGRLYVLHLPAYLPDTVGGLYGSVHSRISRWAWRLFHNATLCPPSSAHDHGSDRTRPKCSRWAQKWAQKRNGG